MRYSHALRAHALLIVAVTAAALLAALAVVLTATKRYDASADVQIQAMSTYGNDPFQGLDVFRQPADGSSPAVAAARIFSSPSYTDLLRRKLGSRGADVQVSATPLSQADIVSLAASAPTAALAAHAANRFAAVVTAERKALFQRELRQRIAQVQVQMRSVPKWDRTKSATYPTLAATLGQLKTFLGDNDPTVQLLTPATTPPAAAWPRPKLTLIVALVVGLLLGVAAAVALEVLNPRVTREDELALEHRLPILARMPRLRTRAVREYFLGRSPLPREAWKAYRTLRAVLANAGTGESRLPSTILVTSACAGDGKTLTAVNLAIALSSSGLRVTLVDADLPRPMVATIFNVPGHRNGVVRLLRDPDASGTGTIDAPLHERLKLLLSSQEQMHDLQLLDSRRAEQLVARLQRESDVVVIDSPPLPEVAEALAFADVAEAVLVCVRVGHTRRDKLAELRELLGRRGVTPLGFFVTSRQRPRRGAPAYEGYPADLPSIPGDYLVSSSRPVPSESS